MPQQPTQTTNNQVHRRNSEVIQYIPDVDKSILEYGESARPEGACELSLQKLPLEINHLYHETVLQRKNVHSKI